MATTDLQQARQDAKRTAKLAVRLFALEPSAVHEHTVTQAWARVRMLDELRSSRAQQRLGGRS